MPLSTVHNIGHVVHFLHAQHFQAGWLRSARFDLGFERPNLKRCMLV